MSNQKREDGINNTYNLLFGHYDNLPEEEQDSYENIVAYITEIDKIENARDCHIEWKKQHNFDPFEDWANEGICNG